jgi:AraC-like DNA-binding protein
MSSRPATFERRRSLYEEATEIIDREYDRELELEDVARRIATSRRQLQRAFAEAGGTSFRSHLAAVRMRRALELLEGGAAPVREVAQTVGYRQPAQFAKAFRRHHGASPSAFRRPSRPSATRGAAQALAA